MSIIKGTNQNDKLQGTPEADIIFGLNGDDSLNGLEGDDILDGRNGSDTLQGGDGNDTLIGGRGNDRLYAGKDQDKLTGGRGDDIFVIGKDTGSTTLTKADLITDFGKGKDLIELTKGLTFENLSISQGTKRFARDTVITNKFTTQVLAVLQGVNSSTIDKADFISSPANAEDYTFTNIADTNTSIPNGTGNFSFFNDQPSIDNDTVGFSSGGSGQYGIYTGTGGSLTKVVDTNTPIPDGTGSFTGFGDPALENGNVAFGGIGDGQAGIYTIIGSSLGKVVDLNTPVPDATGNFSDFNIDSVSFDGTNVAFGGASSTGGGIYTLTEGSLRKVADSNTPIPNGTGNFTSFTGPVSIDNKDVAFIGEGSSGQSGIYLDDEGSLITVVDENTPIPNGTGNFLLFGRYSLDDERVAFTGFGSEESGIYIDDGDSLTKVVDTNTPIPEGTGNFTIVDFPVLEGENVLFLGERNTGTEIQRGIYISDGNSITKVIDTNDTLDGKELADVNSLPLAFGIDSLSDNSIAFVAQFSDGSSGIYRADPVVLGLENDFII